MKNVCMYVTKICRVEEYQKSYQQKKKKRKERRNQEKKESVPIQYDMVNMISLSMRRVKYMKLYQQLGDRFC